MNVSDKNSQSFYLLSNLCLFSPNLYYFLLLLYAYVHMDIKPTGSCRLTHMCICSEVTSWNLVTYVWAPSLRQLILPLTVITAVYSSSSEVEAYRISHIISTPDTILLLLHVHCCMLTSILSLSPSLYLSCSLSLPVFLLFPPLTHFKIGWK